MLLRTFLGSNFVTVFLAVFTILLFGCLHALLAGVIKQFFRIVPNSVPNLTRLSAGCCEGK